MELLRQVVLSIDAKYGDMQREAQRLGKLSKVLKLKGSSDQAGLLVSQGVEVGCGHCGGAAHAMESKMKTIDAIDDELTDLEDMVDQLDRYTGSLGTALSLNRSGMTLVIDG